MRDGLGPYLAIYLIAVGGPENGWNEATIGTVITIAGIVGLVAQTPAGILIDRATNRRAIIIVAAMAVTVSSVILPFVSGLALIAISQSVASLAAAVFAPAIAAVTLGLMGPKLFAPRIATKPSTMQATPPPQAGLIIVTEGYTIAFWTLGAVAAVGLVLYARFMPETKQTISDAV